MDIRVPALAEGIDSGTIVEILVKVGDTVKKDDPILDIETNKAVVNIPATEDGAVSKIHVKEGDEVGIGAVLVTIGEGGTGTPQPAAHPTAASGPKAAPATPVPGADYYYQSKSGFPPPAAPSIRKMAHEFGIDLSRIPGSGHGGRITREDIQRYMQYSQSVGSAQASTAKKAHGSIDFSKWGGIKKVKMTKLRKTIAQAMTDAWTTIPHVTQFDDMAVDSIMKLIAKHKEKYKAKKVRLTLTAVVIRAVVDVLKQFPDFNASFDEDAGEIVYKKYFHIGIAVDTEHGLMVPVLRDADKKSIFEISKELAELAQKTRDRKLSIEDMRGGSFTISNQGGIGSKHFTPIINPPQVAILGLGRGYPAYEQQTLMPVALSYDHRLIDGAGAARFMVALAEALNRISEKDIALGNKKKGSKS